MADQAPKPIKLPPTTNMTIDNITTNTILTNSQGPNPRLTFLLSRLVTHLHDFARETRLSSSEWMAALNYLVAVGQISTDVRHEFILLSDILGLSLLVDAIDHPKPPSSTEGSVLGPFHTHTAPAVPSGTDISSDPAGEACLVLCSVKDTHGNPVPDVKIDIWETDSTGHYDVQHADLEGADGRCVIRSEADGSFWFKAITPVSYPIPHDGPVGKLLNLLGRHPWRPAHMHFMFEKDGWDHLITALYVKGDQYLTSDAVFGVKESLVVELGTVTAEHVEKYGVKPGTRLIERDFVLVGAKETEELRDANARREMERLWPGKKVRLLDHLPVPDLD